MPHATGKTADKLIPMTENAALLKLLTWLSPAFPVGAFAYSHGLERAVYDGLISGRRELEDWLRSILEIGSGWNDAVLLAEAWRVGSAALPVDELAELAEALAGSEERHRETMLQGAAFMASGTAWRGEATWSLPQDCAYCVAVGAFAGRHAIPLRAALAAYLQAFAANLVQASIRLGVTGQGGGLETLAALEPVILAVADRAERSTLDDLGSAAALSEIMAMRHEMQASRIFRS